MLTLVVRISTLLGRHHILYKRHLETTAMPKTSKARAVGLPARPVSFDPTETKWLCSIRYGGCATKQSATPNVSPRLFLPQASLAQALQMQLVHPFVAKTVLAEESE